VSMAPPPRRTRRVNLRALGVVALAVALLVPAAVALKILQDQRGLKANLREAKRHLSRREPALALGYLNRYLELQPDDVAALDLKAKLLADDAHNEAEALDAVQVHSQVLGRDPAGPGRQETRRRLVRLNLMVPGRARAAEAGARDLIRRGADDAEAHRLLAHALELVGAAEAKPAVMDEARREYEAAEAKAPGDVEGAERLSMLYRDRMDDPAKAERVLDALVDFTAKAPAKHAEALLARARHFTAAGQPAKAEADVERAVRDDPAGVAARLAAAEVALARRDPAAARRHLAAIDPSRRDDLRIKVADGMIDLAERRPDEAIRHWRAGLLQTGGGDADLTWRLAHALLETGRAAEAGPLVSQYRRLVGGDSPDYRYRYLRALSLLRTNRPAEAAAEFEAIRYKVDKSLEPHLYYALGQCLEATRDAARAADAYRQAADRARAWGAPWTALARLQAETRPAEAAATLRDALALNPTDPKLLSASAALAFRVEASKPEGRQSWDVVDRALAQAREAAPGSPDLALVEAEYAAARGRPDDADGLLQTAAGMSPGSTELWLARANLLARRGRFGRALEVLDGAVAAAGPQAGFFTTRASVLVLKSQLGEARKALTEGLTRVPAEQRPSLWKALGELYRARDDPAAARSAFSEWARLQPENPEPKIALLDLALAANDDAAVALAVESVRGLGGPKAYYWRLARVQDLLRERKGEAPDAGRDAGRLAEAEALTKEIQAGDPRLPLGHLLEGRVRERQGRVDAAVSAYRAALRLDGGRPALGPLVALLVREGWDRDLAALRDSGAAPASEVDRLASSLALRGGDKGRAERLAALAVRGDPRGVDARVWQAEVLRSAGKPDEAEAALRELTGRRPDEPAPWLQLLMFQVGRKQTAAALATVEQIKARVDSPRPELLWAQCYRAAGDAGKAAEFYRKALDRWPDDPAVLDASVGFLEQSGRADEAVAALRSALRRDPADGRSARKLALLLASRPGDGPAWREALSLVGPGPRPDDRADDLLARAGVYALGPEPGHRRQAVAILGALLGDLPELAEGHEQLARLLFAAGDAAGARAHAEKAAAGDGAGADAALFYASVLLALGDAAGAGRQLDRLAAVDPDGLPVAELRARVLAARGKAAEGASALEKAYDDHAGGPDAAALGDKMVRLLTALNQPEAAERVARKAAGAGPVGKCLLAELLAARGAADEAAGLLRAAAADPSPTAAAAAEATALNLAARPGADARWLDLSERLDAGAPSTAAAEDYEALRRRASLRHLQHRYAEEVEVYRAMLALRPADSQFLNNMAWTLSEDLGRPVEALDRADEALAKAGARPAVLDTRGVILTRLGRLDEATRDLETAAREQPTGEVYFHLARAHLKSGRAGEARKFRDLARRAGLSRDQLQPSEQADWAPVMAP